MLQAKDLRIGNLVYYVKDIVRIDVSDLAVFKLYEKNGEETYYRPIPLTEEWLLKSDCEKNDEGFICDRFILTWNAVYKFWYVREDQLGAYLTKLEYVHEWQNFYFILQGEELTLKDK